jgi:hypothetical protein
MIRKSSSSAVRLLRSGVPFLLKLVFAFLLVLLSSSPSLSNRASSTTAPFATDLQNREADVLVVVQAVADDHIIRGTYVYAREKILGEAVAESSSVFFGPWKDGGRAFYKVRRDALAPRNFKDSSDIGVITVRYVVRTISPERTHLEISAVFVEDGTHRVHPSDSSVETSEFAEIQNQLTTLVRDRQQAAEIQKKKNVDAEKASALAQQRTEEIARYQDVESSLKILETRAHELQRAVEVRIPAPNTELKSAPFRGASILAKIPANSDVLVEIVTTYWYGVETADGRRGWVRRDQVVPLP